jgi:hypothetical protein
MARTARLLLTLALASTVFAASVPVKNPPALERLAYNNPGLLMDRVVACTDTPSNGVDVFLNTERVDPVVGLPIVGAAMRVDGAGPSPRMAASIRCRCEGGSAGVARGVFAPDLSRRRHQIVT